MNAKLPMQTLYRCARCDWQRTVTGLAETIEEDGQVKIKFVFDRESDKIVRFHHNLVHGGVK